MHASSDCCYTANKRLHSETLALEDPTALFPFLHFLTTHHSFARSAPPPLSEKSRQLLAQPNVDSTRPTLLPGLQSNETFALLEFTLTRSLLLKGKGQRESLRLSLGARETSVVIEGMRLLELEREEQTIPRPWINGVQSMPRCESWLDVNGHVVCSEKEFWELVGTEQKDQAGPIVLPQT